LSNEAKLLISGVIFDKRCYQTKTVDQINFRGKIEHMTDFLLTERIEHCMLKTHK